VDTGSRQEKCDKTKDPELLSDFAGSESTLAAASIM
jgi:hypothetical protein